MEATQELMEVTQELTEELTEALMDMEDTQEVTATDTFKKT